MNVYVIVEGELGAKKLYASWVPFVNPTLTYAPEIGDVIHNHFYVEACFGWPGYFDRIRAAIANVATLYINGYRQFDRLVVTLDSEDMSLTAKEAEVRGQIGPALAAANPPIDCRVLVQHFCIETWALGNRRLAAGRPDPLVSKYRAIHNVHALDPEFLPPLAAEGLNRARFAYKYLRLLHNARYHRSTYSKNDPNVVAHRTYFDEVKSRFRDTGHIGSFSNFLIAFA